jgi:hypothetical protein
VGLPAHGGRIMAYRMTGKLHLLHRVEPEPETTCNPDG